MSHEEYCEPEPATVAETNARRARWIAWWPQGQPAEVDVATLPAAGGITSPLRLIEDGDWLGVWGNFQGLRIAYSVTESFQVMSPCAVRYPEGVDIFLSADTGGSGIASFGRFKTREAALAWGGSRPSSGAKIVSPATNYSFAADGVTDPTLLPGSADFNFIQNDRTGTADRLRQPDSTAVLSAQNGAVSIATTGVKCSITVASNKYARFLSAGLTNVTGGAPNILLQLVRSGVTTMIWGKAPAIGTSNFIDIGNYHLQPGDVVQWNVTGVAAANTADFYLAALQDRFTF